MDKLLHTSLYQAILKSLNRKATSEKRLQTYFFEFANEITIICNNTEYLSVLHTLNYTQIQFQYLLFRLPELSVPPPPYVSRFILKALEFIRLEKELLYYRLEHPRLFISDPVPKSSLYWSKQYHAIDLSEILCTFDLMNPNPLVLVNGRAAPFNTVIREFEQFLHVKLGEPSDIKRRVLDRKRDRSKFVEIMLHTLNEEDNQYSTPLIFYTYVYPSMRFSVRKLPSLHVKTNPTTYRSER